MKNAFPRRGRLCKSINRKSSIEPESREGSYVWNCTVSSKGILCLRRPPVCDNSYKFAVFREETTSAYAGFHAGPLSRSNWNLETSDFMEGEKPDNPEKNPQSKAKTNNKLNPHMTPGPGIEPGPHWWKASDLTTALSLLPIFTSKLGLKSVLMCYL